MEREKLYEKRLDASLRGQSAKIDQEANLLGSGRLFQSFESVAKEFQVPTDILLSISLHESGFQMKRPDPETSPRAGWGLMGLGSQNNPDSILNGAKLLQLDIEALKNDPLQNIRASAAVLNDLKIKILGKKKSKDPKFKDYHAILKRYAGTGDEFSDQLFADEIFMILKTGYSQKLESGEVITIEARLELENFEPAPLR